MRENVNEIGRISERKEIQKQRVRKRIREQ